MSSKKTRVTYEPLGWSSSHLGTLNKARASDREMAMISTVLGGLALLLSLVLAFVSRRRLGVVRGGVAWGLGAALGAGGIAMVIVTVWG